MRRKEMLSWIAATVLGLGALACNTPPCRECGFSPGADVLITYNDGTHATTHADSSGCVTYRCGTVRRFTQLESPVIIREPPQS